MNTSDMETPVIIGYLRKHNDAMMGWRSSQLNIEQIIEELGSVWGCPVARGVWGQYLLFCPLKTSEIHHEPDVRYLEGEHFLCINSTQPAEQGH